MGKNKKHKKAKQVKMPSLSCPVIDTKIINRYGDFYPGCGNTCLRTIKAELDEFYNAGYPEEMVIDDVISDAQKSCPKKAQLNTTCFDAEEYKKVMYDKKDETIHGEREEL